MLTKISSWLCIFFFALLWLAGCHAETKRKIAALGIVEDDFRYGDLYRLSHLRKYKQIEADCSTEISNSVINQNVNLFILGDSFVENIDSSQIGYSRLKFHHWKESTKDFVNPKAQNSLIIECAERNVRRLFSKPFDYFTNQKVNKIVKNDYFDFVFPEIDKTELHLEQILFSKDIFLFFRELKADLNFALFNRLPDEVAENQEHTVLFLKEEVAKNNEPTSFFAKLNDKEMELIYRNLEIEVKKLSNLGFSKIYISIIPSKGNILGRSLGNYNNLIPKLENTQIKGVEYISIFDEFIKNPDNKYRLGDTHWTCEGKRVWLKTVQKRLN